MEDKRIQDVCEYPCGVNVRCSVNCSSSVDWLEYLKLSSVSFIEYSTRDSFTRSYQSHNLILKAATSCIYRDWFSLESITALKCIHFFETQDYAQLYHLLSKLSNLLRTFTWIDVCHFYTLVWFSNSCCFVYLHSLYR